MPRDGSGIYTTPPGTTAVADTTIESAKYNANVADVAADLNAVRPIIAGGTGANNPAGARITLQAEVAAKEVTNYDTHAFEAGSFFSAPGATAEPIPGGGWYTYGICMRATDGAMQLDAWVSQGGAHAQHWTRTKWGAWLPWVKQAGSEADFVNTAGDTMTGDLLISKAQPVLSLSKAAAGQSNIIQGNKAGAARWWIRPGNDEPETGSDAGSNLDILRWTDAGSFAGALSINRASGNVAISHAAQINGALTLSSNLTVANGAVVNAGGLTVSAGGIIGDTVRSTNWLMTGDATTGLLYFNNTATKYLQFDGTNFNFSGGSLSCTGAITATAGINAGSTILTSGGLIIVQGATPQLMFQNASGVVKGQVFADVASGRMYLRNPVPNVDVIFDSDGSVYLGNGFHGKQGSIGPVDGYVLNFRWTGALMEAWVGGTYVGAMTLTSDYRIKKDVVDLPSTWDAVKALRPVSYTQAQYTSDVELAARKEAAAKRVEQGLAEDKLSPPLGPMFAADDIERWGFVAHEVQETLLPSAASAVKDDPVAVQSLNLAPIVASLTKALQEAMARIEALEAAAAVPAR